MHCHECFSRTQYAGCHDCGVVHRVSIGVPAALLTTFTSEAGGVIHKGSVSLRASHGPGGTHWLRGTVNKLMSNEIWTNDSRRPFFAYSFDDNFPDWFIHELLATFCEVNLQQIFRVY